MQHFHKGNVHLDGELSIIMWVIMICSKWVGGVNNGVLIWIRTFFIFSSFTAEISLWRMNMTYCVSNVELTVLIPFICKSCTTLDDVENKIMKKINVLFVSLYLIGGIKVSYQRIKIISNLKIFANRNHICVKNDEILNLFLFRRLK